MPGTIRHLYALVVVLVGWVFFFSTGLQEAFRYLGMMIGIGTKGFAGAVTVFTLTSHWLLWVAGIFGSTRLPIRPVSYTHLPVLGYAQRHFLPASPL